MTEKDILKEMLSLEGTLPTAIQKPSEYMFKKIEEDIQVREYGSVSTYEAGSYIVLAEDSTYPSYYTAEDFNKKYTQVEK